MLFTERKPCAILTHMPEGNIEAEIAKLEQQLAQKRQALETEGSHEQAPSDQELVHEAVGERIKEQQPSYQPAPTPAPASDTGASWQDPAIASQVQALVNTAFSDSLDKAIAEALKTHNPAIIDAFHDLLRDQLLGELVKRGKIQAPSS